MRTSVAFAAAIAMLGAAFSTLRAQQPQTVNDGVYTAAQAMRGQMVYANSCLMCHGNKLQGSDSGGPSLTGKDFVADFKDMTVGQLLMKISNDMPSDAPGTLAKDQYADVTAYVLSYNKYPAGMTELADGDALNMVKMAAPPAAARPAARGAARGAAAPKK